MLRRNARERDAAAAQEAAMRGSSDERDALREVKARR